MSLLCTRPEGEGDALVGRLRELGYAVHAVPTVVTEPLPFAPPRLDRFDWVVVTSATGARALLDRVPAPPAAVRWAAVGPRTAAALAERGIAAAAVPRESRGVNVAGAIAAVQSPAGLRVLLARADAAAGDLPRALRQAGALVEDLAVYHTVVGPEASRVRLDAALADPRLAGAVFASGSAVRGLLRLGGEAGRRLPAVTIGPATSAVARQEGLHVAAEAARPDVDGLVAAVCDSTPPDLTCLC
ncbi:MAG TPA: uroporphyrinogen-III synthase [Candidatus Eisenbacteria bacterium]|nr:uroporphyrinogen-III synthase [Candidatus Eisenbacteria bacterium]